MTEPMISVVIPVYNVEKYIGGCIDSVLAQTFRDFELICVNDGSTDGSLAILNEYAEKDDRVKVVDKENGGYGHSINRGLEVARGTWISIIESDDHIAPTMFESLLNISKNAAGEDADIVKSSYWLYYDDEETGEPFVAIPAVMNNMPSRIFEFTVYEHNSILHAHPCIWTALYRKAFLDEHQIKMHEIPGAGWADNPWMFETLLQAKSIIWTPEPFYYYRQDNPDASSNLKDFRLPFERLRDLWDIVDELHVTDEGVISALYRRTFMYIDIVTIDHRYSETDPELRQLIDEALDRMDYDFLKDPESGIPKGYVKYYEDFKGISASRLAKPHEAAGKPDISIVVALRNDRRVLCQTIDNIMKQKGVSFEVIFASCSDEDLSREIAETICAADERFSLLPDHFKSLWDACIAAARQARGTYVHFIRPGVRYSNPKTLQRAVGQLDAHEGVDVGLCVKAAGWASFMERQNDEDDEKAWDCLVVPVEGNAAELISVSGPELYNKVFRRDFAVEHFPNLSDLNDPVGVVAVSRLMPKATQALIITDCWMNLRTRVSANRMSVLKWKELVRVHEESIRALWQIADEGTTLDEVNAAETCALRVLALSLAKLGVCRADERYFDKIKELFESRYGNGMPRKPEGFCGYRDYLWLTQTFSIGYERFTAWELGGVSAARTGISISCDVATDRLKVAKAENKALKKKLAAVDMVHKTTPGKATLLSKVERKAVKVARKPVRLAGKVVRRVKKKK